MQPPLRIACRVVIGGLAAALCVTTASAQSPGREPTETTHFIGTPAGWEHPRTPWGDPDLTGVWPISYVGSVPLERCRGGRRGGDDAEPCDLNKAFLTEAEYRAALEAAANRVDRHAAAIAAGDFGAALQAGVTDPTTPQRQTSLIMDPPNGRLPEMTPEGKRLSSLMKSSWSLGPDEKQVWDHWTDFDTWDRCITRGMPSSMMPYRYNNGLEIIQAPGYVVLNLEMIHEARIVPLDGRPGLSPAIRQWMGESRGHWEGNTLVVETTNYKPGASATNIGVFGSPPGNRFPTSAQMRTIERFTRLNDEMMLYEITTEDPVVLTRPWTVRFPLKLTPEYQWWEYNCHEGNRTIRDYISASRAERAAAAAAGNAQQPAPDGRRGTGGRRGR